MKKKIEIKNIFGNVLFTHECEDNSVKITVEEAVRQDVSLYMADLRGADLRGADLLGADLLGAKNIPFIPIACPSDGSFIGWKKNKRLSCEIAHTRGCETQLCHN